MAGTLTLLCHEAVVGPRAQALLAGAGIAPPPGLRTYADTAGYLALLDAAVAAGGRLASLHPFARYRLPDGAWLVPPALAWRLNDKAELEALVPLGHAPARRRVPAADLARVLGAPGGRPAVVKLAGGRPSGAGSGVRIVRRRRHLARALALAEGEESVLVEQWLPLRRSYCVVAAALADGRVLHLGTSDQLCTRRGIHYGNWIDRRRPPSAAASELGLAVVRRGAAEGYVGIAGIDVGELPDGRVRALDPNFRFVASTGLVLQAEAIARQTGAGFLRLASGHVSGPPAAIDRAAAAVERLQRAGRLRVVSFFDAVPSSPAPDSALLACILTGERPADAARSLGELAGAGIQFNGEVPGPLRRLAAGLRRRLRG